MGEGALGSGVRGAPGYGYTGTALLTTALALLLHWLY